MIGNSLGMQFEQTQSVKLTPAQLRTIEILQMSAAELEQTISDALLENPVLEPVYPEHPDDERAADPGREPDDDAYDGEDLDRYDEYDRCVTSGGTDSEWRDLHFISRGESKASAFEAFYKSEKTLRDHLMDQLISSMCGRGVRDAAEFIIYSLDSNGYLDISFDEIVEDSGHDARDVKAALDLVRGMDPAGLAAWTLEECLRLQLDEQAPLYMETCTVIESMLHDVAVGDTRKISRTLGISQDAAASIVVTVKGLDPKPGARFYDGKMMQYVVPDVEIEVRDGRSVLHMTDVQPPLGLNKYYCDLSKSTNDKEVRQYLKEKIESANQLIDNIEQRKRTIESVTLAILSRQRNFLEPGNKILEPLTMQQIADDLGIHVSTVSRAVRDKFMRFPTATYPLRYFFTNEVGGVSRDNVYSRIRSIIAGEDHSKPLSDQAIADILSADGISASRRTVAKYRDSMGILPKSLRKTT